MGEGTLASKLIESCGIGRQLLLGWILDPKFPVHNGHKQAQWLSQLKGSRGER